MADEVKQDTKLLWDFYAQSKSGAYIKGQCTDVEATNKCVKFLVYGFVRAQMIDWATYYLNPPKSKEEPKPLAKKRIWPFGREA